MSKEEQLEVLVEIEKDVVEKEEDDGGAEYALPTDSLLFDYSKPMAIETAIPASDLEKVPDAAKNRAGSVCCCVIFTAVLATGILLATYDNYKDRSAVYIAGIIIVTFAVVCIFPCCCAACCFGSTDKDKKKKDKDDDDSIDKRFKLKRLNVKWDTKKPKSLFTKRLGPNAHKLLKTVAVNENMAEKEKKKAKAKEIEFVLKEAIKNNKNLTEKKLRGILAPTVYVLRFVGDILVSDMEDFRDKISYIIRMACENDEVVVIIESPGGAVHSYGLAASQLMRLKAHGLKLTVCIDTIAASGGYMMAVCGDKIIAAPFAYVGSIGVVSYMANIQRILDDKKVDTFLFTAGEFKRTVDFVGEVTQAGIDKQQEELETIYEAFKKHIYDQRGHTGKLNVDEVATGEAWLATDALARGLVDEIGTSDEYIFSKCENYDVYEVVDEDDEEEFWKKVIFGKSTHKSVQDVVRGAVTGALNLAQDQSKTRHRVAMV